MKKPCGNAVFRLLSDLRLGAVLLGILAVAAGAATLLESRYAGLGSSQTGRAAAYDLVYDALWFNILMAVLFANLLLNLILRLRRGLPRPGFLLVHAGILIILAGAGITRWFGFEGYLHIREGQSNNVVTSAATYVRVESGDGEDQYPVRLYRPGPQRLSRRVAVEDQALELGVAEFWPRYEQVMVAGEGGSARVTLSVMEQGGLTQHVLDEGGELSLMGTPVRFHRGGLPSRETPDGAVGVLRVRAGGEVCRLPVWPTPGALGVCGSWTFELIEYQAHFHGHEGLAEADETTDPMARVKVSDPDGRSAVRTLFAHHPEFALASESDALLRQVDLLFVRGGSIDLAVVDGQVVMRAAIPLEVSVMGGGDESRSLAAGEVSPLQLRRIYRGDGGLRFVPTSSELSLVPAPAHSQNSNAPAAARLYLAKDGQRAEAICVRGGAPQAVALAGRTYWLAYGAIRRTLPYSLYLAEFRLETYPGSDNPASFESHLQLHDPERGIEGRPVRVWMNNPLNYRGAKHFQSSYDRDRQGTVLSVNRDPGKIPTYIGYTVFTLGFVLVMARALGGGKKRRPNALRAVLLLVGAVWLRPDIAAANPGPTAPHGGRAVMPEQGPPPVLQLSGEARELASRLIVQDYRGRMKPLDTLARETAVKVTRKTVFEGHDPVELFLAFAVLPSEWYRHPAIAVVNPGVKDLLGLGHDQTHVALAKVLAGGKYSLQGDVELAQRTAPGQRSKTQQQLIRFDERVNLMYEALRGTSLRIFPLPDDPGDKWADDQTVLAALAADDPRRAEFEAASEALFAGLKSGDQTRIVDGLRRTTELQRRYGKNVKPSALRIDSELRLNRWRPFQRAIVPYLAGFVLLIVAYFVHLFRRAESPWPLRHPLYAAGMLLYVGGFALHTYGFVLRWIASARAPLSNAHESLLWVALAVALAGLIFERKSRTAAAGALASLLAAGVLGVSMLGAFDPAIGPLVPVLASYWLIIHVTVITASYGFFALCCLLGLLTLVLLITAALGRGPVAAAAARLDRLNVDVMMAGLGLLAVGTLLGGVWANESWGRYWGWDPKETWALVSILVYALVLHCRWLPKLANVYMQAASAFMSIWVIIMTYFGVNNLLVGLHSYAVGEAARVPGWAILSFLLMAALTLAGFFAWRDTEVRRLAQRDSTPDGRRD